MLSEHAIDYSEDEEKQAKPAEIDPFEIPLFIVQWKIWTKRVFASKEDDFPLHLDTEH